MMKITTFVTLCLLLNSAGYGQRTYDTITTNIMSEIVQIQALYGTSDHLSFDAVYYYEDIDSIVVKDTMQASYQLNQNKFHITMDSVKTIQNDDFLISVYTSDSMLVVQKPVDAYKNIMMVDAMDSTFQLLALSGLTASDSSNFRTITFYFDSDAMYDQYKLVYDKNNYRVVNIRYAIKKDLEEESDRKINMVINFSNFLNNAFNDSVFSTDPYIDLTKSESLQPGYLAMDFEIVNMISEE